MNWEAISGRSPPPPSRPKYAPEYRTRPVPSRVLGEARLHQPGSDVLAALPLRPAWVGDGPLGLLSMTGYQSAGRGRSGDRRRPGVSAPPGTSAWAGFGAAPGTAP